MTKGRLLTTLIRTQLSCGLGLFLWSVSAEATTFTWRTALTGSWTVATNWLPNGVPGSSDVAVITTAGTYEVNINGNVNVNAINLGSNARLRVNGVTLTTTTGIAVGASSTLELNSATLNGGGVSLNGQLSSTGTSNVNVALSTASSSTITVGAGSLTVANGFTNLGLISYPATGTRNFYVTSGTLTNAAAGTISCATTGLLNAVLDNQGSINSTGPQGFLTLGKSGATSTNSGSISASSGAYLMLNGYNDTFNTSGNLSTDSAILRVSGGVFQQTGGTISGSGHFELISTTSATFASNPTTAFLYLAGSGIVFPSALANSAAQQITIGPDAEITVPQFTNQSGRTLDFTGYAATIHAPVITYLGTFYCPRHLVLDGNLNLGPASTIYMGIAGLQQGTYYDWLDVSGAVQLNGTLTLEEIPPGFLTPQPGQTFDLITAGDRLGDFGQIVQLGAQYYPPDIYLVTDPSTTSGSTQPYRFRFVYQKWTPVSASGTPPEPRRGHSSVYAPTYNEMIVFGGQNANGQMLNDVWVLGLSGAPGWWKLNPTGTPPAPRKGHSAVYDVGNNRMIVFGGETDSSAFPSDIWILTNADGSSGTPAWEPFASITPVAGRSGHAVGYNPVSNRMVMSHGGQFCWGAPGDMWVLDHANGMGTPTGWTSWSIPGTPPAIRRDAAFAYDPIRNRLLVYGGNAPCGAVFTDAFVLTNADGTPDVYTAWSQLGSGMSLALPGQTQTPAVYDPYYDRLLTFGGREADGTTLSSGVFMIANTLGNAGWTELPPPATRPSARASHSMIYSLVSKRWVVFGGEAGGQIMNDVWALELDDNAPQVSGVESGPTTPKKQRVLAFSASPSPNPSSHGMQFSVKALEDTEARIAIYDALGRQVAELQNGPITAGEHQFQWKGNVASGMYFVAVRSGSTEDVRRVVVMR